MSNPSNLYAEKVFAEHPLALWALDDQSDYISLLPESSRDYSSWTISGGTVSEETNPVDAPFSSSYVAEALGDVVSATTYGQIVLTSPDIVNIDELNDVYDTFAIGAYFYSENAFISSLQVGYQYYDSSLGQYVLIEDTPENKAAGITPTMKASNVSAANAWIFVSDTFSAPISSGNIQLVLKIDYLGGASTAEENKFYINGASFGQWAEEFSATSLGQEAIDLPSDIALPASKVMRAEAYGLQENPGYYFVNDNFLMSRNAGIPLVYGASNVTTVFDNGELPSLIIPGMGFMNEVGRFKESTFEMWLRINPETTDYRRIFGPIASTDGLYTNGPFLTLKIGNNTASHYVGEWFRPMLVHIEIIRDSASLLINGEQVFSMDIDTATVELPSEFNSENKSQDWLGFYGYSDVYPIDIEAVAVYSYQVPEIVAKRRWVFGQGVEFPENINASYSGTSVLMDYPFANYANNYNYPDIGNWGQGVAENLNVSPSRISSPEYQLPEIIFNNKTSDDWFNSIESAQDEDKLFINLFPDNSFKALPTLEDPQVTGGHLFFDTFNFLINGTRAFYATFKEANLSAEIQEWQDNEDEIYPEEEYPYNIQTLIYIQDRSTTNYFEAVLNIPNNTIDYIVSYGDQTETIYSTPRNPAGEDFVAGLEMRKASDFFGGKLAAFFGKTSSLSMYVGGRPDFTQTFRGNIYNVGLATNKNIQAILPNFEVSGIPLEYDDVFDLFLDDTTIEYDGGDSYFGSSSSFFDEVIDGGDPPTLLPSIPTTKIPDHAASYLFVPSENFGNFMFDVQTQSSWEDYVPMSYFSKFVTDEEGESFYDVDFVQFNVDYPFFEIVDGQFYDTSGNNVKAYISFQYLATGANAAQGFFTSTYRATANNTIRPGSDWVTSKYEVVDGSIVYLPKGVDFRDIAIVVYIDINTKSIINSPVSIRSLKMSSQALSPSSPTEIGSRFGVPLYPFKKSGIYFNYKTENPFTIYKGSTPYLYLTRNSGIQLQGDFDENISRGLSIPINQGLSSDYKVIASQLAMRYEKDQFPAKQTELFEIQSNNKYVKFYLEPIGSTRKRAKIVAFNALTNALETGISFYLNGNLVRNPVITAKEWAMIGIGFANTLNFDNFAGAIRLTGPVVFNNISHYQSTNLQQVQNVTTRPWLRVRFLGISELDWAFWESAYTWEDVLIIASTSYYGVDPQDIYKTYTGTNKFIVDDSREFRLSDYEYTYRNNVIAQTQTIKPV